MTYDTLVTHVVGRVGDQPVLPRIYCPRCGARHRVADDVRAVFCGCKAKVLVDRRPKR